MECADVADLVHAFLDDEIADEERTSFEAHLARCARCGELCRQQAGLRAALRATLPRAPLPAGLRERIVARLDREPEPLRPAARRARRLLAGAPVVAVAAALALLVISARDRSAVIDESLDRHRRDLPVEIPGPDADSVRTWFRGKVDFPVLPPHLERARANLLGGRLSHIRDRQAAYLVYRVDGNRVSLFIFDPGDLALSTPRRARIRDHEVYLDDERGYRVALYRDRGMGYAFASEIDEPALLRLVSASLDPSDRRVLPAAYPRR